MHAHTTLPPSERVAVCWLPRRAVARGASSRARLVSGPHRPLPVVRGRGPRYIVVALLDDGARH